MYIVRVCTIGVTACTNIHGSAVMTACSLLVHSNLYEDSTYPNRRCSSGDLAHAGENQHH